MGGCGATARRHSLLGLSWLLVNTVLIRLTVKILFSADVIHEPPMFALAACKVVQYSCFHTTIAALLSN